MRLNCFKEHTILSRNLKDTSKEICRISIYIIMMVVVVELAIHCEGKERYYRPNKDEVLCSIGIIDTDDTTNFQYSMRDIEDSRNSTRYIMFEKSYQSEYIDDSSSLLNEFSFNISRDQNNVFNFPDSILNKNIFKFELPDSLSFLSGETYSISAKEKTLPEIYASVTVPKPPSELRLVSVKKEIIPINVSNKCFSDNSAQSVVFEISFDKSVEQNQYYMLMLLGFGYFWEITPYSGPVDFTVRNSNTPGFFSEMQGLKTYHWLCTDEGLDGVPSNSFAYFIDESKILDNKCYLTISTQFDDSYSPIESLKNIKIKLLSIPKDLYVFEKSLYTYNQTIEDPFVEPVYLNGNIIHGNGIFAICRSTSLNLDIDFE